MESLKELRMKIKKERKYVDIKSYSHNIITLLLEEIDRLYGEIEANKAVRDFGLKKLGWEEK